MMKIFKEASNGKLDVWHCDCGTYTPVKKGSPQPECEYCRRIKESKKKDVELLEIKDDYLELVKTLHNLMDSLSPDTRNKIWDMVYKRFEP